jgi:hypothetical protein
MSNIASSFRDLENGFIFLDKDGLIKRQINFSYKKNYDLLMSSGLYKKLSNAKLLVSHKEIKNHSKNTYKIIDINTLKLYISKMNKMLSIAAVLAGVLLLILAVTYFALPANGLPHFIPGYSAVLTRHHFTHGIACLFLGLGAFAFAWFSSGKKQK